MFFKLIKDGSRRSRRESRLFFISLIIAVISFYTLLSIEEQDTVRFLKTLEGDAVEKLMTLIPVVFGLSLFFVFFLVYFAYSFEINGRRKELGLYLTLGMRRGKLFLMLMAETLINSLYSSLIGIPCALFLTEAVSLTASRLIGLGLIGHKISFSLPAVLTTLAGFIGVQMLAMLIISFKVSRSSPYELLSEDTEKKQKTHKKGANLAFGISGIILLLCAYFIGVFLLRSLNPLCLLSIFVLGITGTFFFFRGFSEFIGIRIRKKATKKGGLYVFTGRQIQENVVHEYKSLSISSLLLLIAMASVSFGIGVCTSMGSAETRSVDFSIDGNKGKVEQFADENSDYIKAFYEMKISMLDAYRGESYKGEHTYSADGLKNAVLSLPQNEQSENIALNLSSRDTPYLISLSSFNALLSSLGKEPVALSKNEAAYYTSMNSVDYSEVLSHALALGGYIEIDGERYNLKDTLYTENVVADRKITLYSAIIMRDEDYTRFCEEPDSIFCFNIMLKDDIVKKDGLIPSIQSFSEKLDPTGFDYESFLGGIGRNLFYAVAAGYITIYIGFLFLVISNTVIALKFLMQLEGSAKRIKTLLMLGAKSPDICKSVKRQSLLFFLLSFSIAAVSSVFALISLFTSLLRLPEGINALNVLVYVAAAFLVFTLFEFIYIAIVNRICRIQTEKIKISEE